MLRNCWLKWFENRMHYRRLTGRSLGGRRRTAAQNRPTAAFVGETLESRTLLTTFTVNTALDVVDPNDGLTSLREAMQMSEANATADDIRFAANLNGAVLNITQGPLPTITQDLQLLGTVGNRQTINMAGLVVNANGGTTTFAMNSVNINLEPVGAGLQINATNDGVANVTVFNSRITNAATQGINFVAHTGGIVNLTLSNVSILSNGDVVQSAGIKGEVGVDPAGAESNTIPGNFATANLDFSSVTVANQFLEGFTLDVEDGGIVTTPNAIRNSAFSSNGFGNQRSGVRLRVSDAGSSLQANFSASVAHNVTGAGFDFRALNGSTLNIGMTNGASQNAGSDAMNFMVDAANATVNVNGFTALNSGDNGVEGRFTNGAVVSFNTFNNVNINGTPGSGLQMGILSGSTLNAFNATNVTSNGSSAGSGALLTTLTNSVSNFNFTNLTVNNNKIRGVQVGLDQTATSNKTFNNLIATGNQLAQPIGIGVRNGSVLNLTVNGGNLTSAGALVGINNVFAPIVLGSTANLTFDGVNMNNSSSSGIVASYDNSNGTINVRNTTSTGNRAVGVALFAINGGDIDANFENVNVSNAGQAGPANGMRLEVNGPGSTGDFTFDGVTADGAAGQGISLLYNNLAAGSVNQFDNVSARNTGGDGVNVNVRGIGTTLSNFVANGVDVTGAGLGVTQSADGLDIMVVGPGAIGNFDIQDLTADDAGGRGVKLQVENTATAQVSIDDFSADGNGLEGIAVDVGTVVAGAQLMGAVFANGTASNNGQAFMLNRAGIRSTVRGTGSGVDLSLEQVFANSNTDDGIALTGEAGATMSIDLSNGVAALGNIANGVDFRGDGAATTVALTSAAPGNSYIGNGFTGLNVLLTNQVTANEITVQGEASLNQMDGIRVADDGSGVTINSLQVSGNSQMNTNQEAGLAIDLDGAMGLTMLDLSSLSLSDNLGDQINVNLANMSLTDISLDDISVVGTGAGGGGEDGIDFTLDNTDVTNSLALNRITATDNGEDGLEFNFLNGATIPVSSAIDVGTFNDNGQHGVNLGVTNSAISLSLTNSTAVMQNTVSSLSRNGMHGLNVRLDNADLTMDDVDRQTILANGGAGINILGATPSDFISGNTFTNNNISNNLSFGFRGVFNGGTFDITIGEAGAGNVFDNNGGAGIAITQIQNSIGQVIIEDNQITDTNAGSGFAGHGVVFEQLGTVNPTQATNMLTRMGGAGLVIQNNRIGVTNMGVADGNAGSGITFNSEEQSRINGLHVFDNVVSNNGVDGFNLRRLDQVDINNFQVLRNEFTDNMDDGVELLGQNDTNDVLFATMNMNDVSRNDDNGFSFQVNADARISVNLNNNMVIENGTDGIQTREVILDISDERQLSGSWTNNTISNNTRNGIRIGGATSGLSVSNNHIGATFDQFGQVVIDGNGSTGIEINGAGSSTWSDNNIIRNGRLVQNDRSQGHGVDIQGAGFKSNTFNRNIIRQNFQDGIEFNNNGGGNLTFTLTLNDNRIQQNAGRGLDILNQGTTLTTVNIFSGSGNRANNQFSSNGEEGIYIVNTASTSQNQTDFSGADLAQNGATNNSPRLQFFLDEATISNNGSEGNNGMMIASAGVLLRVGSAESASYLGAPNSQASNEFATNGFSSNLLNAGVSATLQDSSLHGNFGDDVFIHGYRSTNTLNALGGTWDAMNFNVNGPGDPLSRLDLRWGLTDYDSVDVNNSTRRGTPDGEAGAFYDNAEGTFKSRESDATPGGPHNANNGANRRRNAQRVPTRINPNTGNPLAPTTGPDGGQFQYPGWGDSTFRVSSVGGTSLFEFGSVSFTPNIQAGELPFTWGGFSPTKTMSTSRTYIENGPPITIDSGLGDIQDPAHDGLNNYDNATLRFQRLGGADAEDVFGFVDNLNGSGLTLAGGNTIQKAGSTIAFFNTTSVPGQLLVTFTDGFGQTPTSIDADNVLRSITYANSSAIPPQMGLTLQVVFTSNAPNQIPQSATCFVNITVVPFNSTPTIVNLGPAGVFGGTPVTLDVDQNVDIQDAELDELNNYNSAVLTIQRQGGANANDNFTFVNGNGLTLNGMNIQKAGQTIATFNNMNGTLTVTFTDANGQTPTSTDADNLLRRVRYNNTNATPPSTVTLNVTINDSGVGGGAAQMFTASVVVTNNQVPAIAALGPADVFITGGPPVSIDNNANANITDAELDALDNYNGAMLTLARQGGANADDNYGFTTGNGLSLVGNSILKAGQSIASFNVVNGTLTINFTDANGQTPTSADADNVLRQVTYQNTNGAPPASVVLVATFDDGGVGGVGNQQAMAMVTVNINTAPTITNLGPANVFMTGSLTGVLLDNDANANIQDLELDNLNNYANSVLTISRQGGANADDVFDFLPGGGLSLVGNNIIKAGQAIASFNSINGTLTIAFTDANGPAPTSVDADNILRQITYRNTNGAPPANVTLDVTFDDGGVAGVGAQQATASVTVTIV